MVLGGSLIVLGTAVAAWQSRSEPVSPPKASTIGAEQAAIGVDALMQNVDAYLEDMVLVEGVVSAVDADRQTLALIDIGEYWSFRVITCADLTLPVRWSGPMPLEREAVQVKGKIQDVKGKLVFVGQKLEKIALKQEGPM